MYIASAKTGWVHQINLHQAPLHYAIVVLDGLYSPIEKGGTLHPPPPGNTLLIGITRSDKIRRKRCAILTSQQHLPRIIFTQISAAII